MRAEARLLALLALVACGEAGGPAGAAEPVRHFGALREIVHEGRTGPALRLREVVPGPHAYGLGARSGLAGEVTVIDDVVWTAIPRDEGTAEVRSGDAGDEAPALFVVARVPRWQEVVLERDIAAAELEAEIERRAAAAGVDTSRPFAVRVSGPLVDLQWHVVDGRKLVPGASHAEHARAGVHGVEARTEGELVGFYSRAHAGVFTHRGSATHFHAVLAGRPLTAHVDAVALGRGAKLSFPAP